MNSAYQDLAFAVFTMMAGMLPFDKALPIAELQALAKHDPDAVEDAVFILKDKVTKWNRGETGIK